MRSLERVVRSKKIEVGWRIRLLILLASVASVLALASFADRQALTSAITPTPPTRTAGFALTGTWRGELDNVWSVRPDGTARCRDIKTVAKGISYFEWRFDQTTLTLIDTSRGPLAFTRDLVFGEDSTDFTVKQISPNEFDLVNPRNGEVQRFVRTADAAVETAP